MERTWHDLVAPLHHGLLPGLALALGRLAAIFALRGRWGCRQGGSPAYGWLRLAADAIPKFLLLAPLLYSSFYLTWLSFFFDSAAF